MQPVARWQLTMPRDEMDVLQNPLAEFAARVQQQDAVLQQQQAALLQQQRLHHDQLAALTPALQGMIALPQVIAAFGGSTKTLAERSRSTLVDNNSLGKPPNFDGREETFLRWAGKTES